MILPKWSVCDFWSAKCRESEDIISLYLNCHRSGFAKLFDNSFKWLWQNLFQVGTHTQRQVAKRLGSLCQLCRRSTPDILTNGFVVKVDYFNLALKFLAIFQKCYIYIQKMYMYKITNIFIYCIYMYIYTKYWCTGFHFFRAPQDDPVKKGLLWFQTHDGGLFIVWFLILLCRHSMFNQLQDHALPGWSILPCSKVSITPKTKPMADIIHNSRRSRSMLKYFFEANKGIHLGVME